MKTRNAFIGISLVLAFGLGAGPGRLTAQARPDGRPVNLLPRTPLPQEVLDLLANEISGQAIFNNEVKLAGAPWLRDEKELTGTFYETETLAALARSCGIADVRIERIPREGTFDYPLRGELWTLTPEKKLLARLEADPALIAGAPAELDVTGGLVVIPPLTADQLKQWPTAGPQEKVAGKIALMWSHAGQEAAKALDAAGVAGVISFNSRERYFDPDQVVYSGGAYRDLKNLKFGFTISWRQWSELVEDVEAGRGPSVRCVAKMAKYPDRFERVIATIPGAEPGRKGVILTAHLFEGYVKRGANDDMSGVVIELEVLRALTKLVRDGSLPQPRRTITFLWPNEISGTFDYIKRTAGLPAVTSININMDMVGEALRKNNSLFTMSECPNYLPSYLDGLADAMMNYVWRTNDIVYVSDAPRGRPGGQYLPRPMWEKNGTIDAFRYFTHETTSGSDHLCFNTPSVGVPGIEFFVWPDQWYHADTDTPDKSDPTEMKRAGFIAAGAAWTAANCSDDVLPELLRAVSAFGHARVGKRELPRAFQMIADADAKTLDGAFARAVNLASFAAAREAGAVQSVEDVYSGSDKSRALTAARVKEWELFGAGLERELRDLAAFRAAALRVKAPTLPAPTAEERRAGSVVPALAADVIGKEFSLEGSDRYKAYTAAHPDAVKNLKLTVQQRRSVLNYINGRRPLTVIRRWAEAETGTDIDFKEFLRFIDFLKAVGWTR